MNQKRKKRIILAKPMLDGHDKGIKLVSKGLKDAGVEVIYLGLFQTPEAIVQAAVQEDADLIGLGTSMGIHKTVFFDTIDRLRKSTSKKIKVIGGGSIPEKDIPALKKMGVDAVFGPNASVDDVVAYVLDL